MLLSLFAYLCFQMLSKSCTYNFDHLRFLYTICSLLHAIPHDCCFVVYCFLFFMFMMVYFPCGGENFYPLNIVDHVVMSIYAFHLIVYSLMTTQSLCNIAFNKLRCSWWCVYSTQINTRKLIRVDLNLKKIHI